MRLFEGTRRSRALSMSDPHTGGVTQEMRKPKMNGVKNLREAQAITEFHGDFLMNDHILRNLAKEE